MRGAALLLPAAAAAAAPPRPEPVWTFRAPIAVTGSKAYDEFSIPALYNNWTLTDYMAMDAASERAAYTRMDTHDGPIPGENAFWSIDVKSQPQTQTVQYPAGSSNCKVYNVTRGFYTFPASVFNLNTGFDDFLYSESEYAGEVSANGGQYQKWVTRKFSGSYYYCEYHVNARGEFAYIQWTLVAPLHDQGRNVTVLDVRATLGPYTAAKPADFAPPPNVTCVPSAPPAPPQPQPQAAPRCLFRAWYSAKVSDCAAAIAANVTTDLEWVWVADGACRPHTAQHSPETTYYRGRVLPGGGVLHIDAFADDACAQATEQVNKTVGACQHDMLGLTLTDCTQPAGPGAAPSARLAGYY